MKTGFILLLSFWVATASYSQSCFRYKKYPVGTSGCFAYFGTEPEEAETEQMEDGSTVYSTQSVCDSYTFGILLVRMGTPLTDLEQREKTLEQYIDIVKEMAGVTQSVGYGKGHIHPETSGATGMIDFCEDKEGNSWNVKGWVNESVVAILFISFPPDKEESIPYSPTQELFFNGFRFE